jgi:hypothetical protein
VVEVVVLLVRAVVGVGCEFLWVVRAAVVACQAAAAVLAAAHA